MREGWIEKRFDEVFTLQMGKTPDRKNKAFFEGTNTWVSIKDLGDKYILSSHECISDEAATNISIVKKGTVIMSFKLTVGKCAIAAKDLYTNEAIMAFNTKDGYEINSSFLYYYLKGYKWNGANKAVMGLTLNKATISKHNLFIPPLSTQLSIVSELDKINELIRLKKEQLKDYDNLAQSIFYEMFGDPVVNEKGWNVKKLGDVCEVSSFKRVLVEDVLEKGPVPFIRGTELSAICKENKREYKMYITMEHYERVKNISGVPNVGDLLIPSINAEGLVWVVDTPEPMYYKDGRVLWVHVDQNSISPIALQRILNNLIKDNYSKITNGAVFAELNLSILRSFPIILPPLSIQNAFANKINLIEKQKAEIQSTIADLETLLASRMQYWFG